MNTFKDIIKDICDELNIKMTIASKGWMIILEKDNQTRYILGNKFDLNTYALGKTFDDKYATYEMLKNLNLPVTYHEILFSPSNQSEFALDCNSYEYAYNFFERNNCNIVIKANEGGQGKNVFHITSREDIKTTLDELFISNYSVSLCPYYDIKSEYRVIMLDGTPELIYKKIKPIIVGDGQSTVKELLLKLNQHYFEDNTNFKIDESKVLENGEIFEYNWQFNLSNGATMTMDIDSNVKEKVLSIAKTVTNKTNLRFASVDVIELYDGTFMILEINCGVATHHFSNTISNGYQITKNIYKKAIIKMFNL
ncbi:MAG: hypothetical protein IJO63_03250 [Bacilli bacterium]|nr:hypothetical protein [Bacilli bacterium]